MENDAAPLAIAEFGRLLAEIVAELEVFCQIILFPVLIKSDVLFFPARFCRYPGGNCGVFLFINAVVVASMQCLRICGNTKKVIIVT